MKIYELKELTSLSLVELSNKIGIPYSRILKLNKQAIEHNTQDYELINNYLETRGKNVIEIDFKTTKRDKRPPFSFERRGEIDLNVYRLNKRRKERAERKPKTRGKQRLLDEWKQRQQEQDERFISSDRQ